MNIFKSFIVVLILLANLVFAQPSFADKPKFLKNPDYIEVTQTLNSLKMAQEAQPQAQAENYNPEEIQQRIDELEFQKYALEMGINWGQCRNETGKTLAVYGPKPKFDDDDYDYSYETGLYFLADGQTTKDKWDCEGIYLPSNVTTTGINPDGQGQEVTGPIAVKIADGTQLVVKTNSDTAAIEFSIPSTKVVKPGEVNWFIPNVSQEVIQTRVANAPTAKAKGNQLVVMKNPDRDSVESKNSPQPQPQPQEESQPQSQSQPTSPRAGFVNRR